MHDYDGLWESVSRDTGITPPTWLWRASTLLFIVSLGVIVDTWCKLSLPPWSLLVGVFGTALFFQLRALCTEPRNVVLSFGTATSFAAAFCLAPNILYFEVGTVEKWTVLGTGAALLSSPLLGRLWKALLSAFDAIAHMKERHARALSAMAGEINALVLEVRERVGGWAEVSIISTEGERMGAVTISTFQRLTGGTFQPSLDVRGCWFLLHGPVEEQDTRWSDPESSIPRIVDAARVEFLGGQSLGLHSSPFLSEIIASIVAITACHLIVLEIVIMGTYWL